MKESVFTRLSFTDCAAPSTYNSRVEMVSGSAIAFSKADLTKVVDCVLLSTKSKFSDKPVLKLLVKAKIGKSYKELWTKLDGTSAKRYADNAPCKIDPSKVIFYQLHDTEEEWGKEENNYSWDVVRVKEGAITVNVGINDDDLLKI